MRPDTADPAADDIALIEARKQLIHMMSLLAGLVKECTDVDTLIAANYHLKLSFYVLHHSNEQQRPSFLQSTYSVPEHPHLP